MQDNSSQCQMLVAASRAGKQLSCFKLRTPNLTALHCFGEEPIPFRFKGIVQPESIPTGFSKRSLASSVFSRKLEDAKMQWPSLFSTSRCLVFVRSPVFLGMARDDLVLHHLALAIEAIVWAPRAEPTSMSQHLTILYSS